MERETPRGQISTRRTLIGAVAVGAAFGIGAVLKQRADANSGGETGPKPDGRLVSPENVGIGVNPDPNGEPFSQPREYTREEGNSLLKTTVTGNIPEDDSLRLTVAGHHRAVWEPKTSGQFRISSVMDNSSGEVKFSVPGESEVTASIQEALLVRPLRGQGNGIVASQQRAGATTTEFTISKVAIETIKGAIAGAIGGATHPAFAKMASDIADILTDGVQVVSGSSIEDSFETDTQSHRVLQKTVDVSAGRRYVFDFVPTFFFEADVENSVVSSFSGSFDYASQAFRVDRVG
jgi:hypothetical protein